MTYLKFHLNLPGANELNLRHMQMKSMQMKSMGAQFRQIIAYLVIEITGASRWATVILPEKCELPEIRTMNSPSWINNHIHYKVQDEITYSFPNFNGMVSPSCISNCIHYKMWDEIIYPFPNFNGTMVEVREWISNFIPHFTGLVITSVIHAGIKVTPC